jgi:hypothetical protein
MSNSELNNKLAISTGQPLLNQSAVTKAIPRLAGDDFPYLQKPKKEIKCEPLDRVFGRPGFDKLNPAITVYKTRRKIRP